MAHSSQKFCLGKIRVSLLPPSQYLILIFQFSSLFCSSIFWTTKITVFDLTICHNSLGQSSQHMPYTNRILKCIIKEFFSTKSLRQSVQICGFPHSCLIIFPDTVLRYRICNLPCSFEMTCNLRDLLWCTNNFKCIQFQVNHIIGHINPTDRINNTILVFTIGKAVSSPASGVQNQYKTKGAKIKHGDIRHPPFHVLQRFLFPVKT